VPSDWSTSGVDLHLDLSAGAGRRAGLEHALRSAIRSGRLGPGTRLPATRTLAAEVGLARGTVSAAYDQLVAEGYLSARTGSGTVVTAVARASGPSTADPEPVDGPRHDLRAGSPDVTTFPVAQWLRSTRRALSAAPMSVFDYGDPRGHIELRTALADYLGRTRGVLAGPERIAITSGYVQALALLAAVVCGPRAALAMEDPGLALHRDVVRNAGVPVLPLAVDDRGARTDQLSTSDFGPARAAVLTPAHQYPTGVTLHPHRRQAAIAWAAEHDALIIEDDYDGEFRYDRQPVGALQGTAPDHVAYLGTASKTLGPALRLAWVVLPERWVEPFLRAKSLSDVHTETIGQLTLADLIRSHAYDRHIRACRLRYRRRRDLLVRRLAGEPFGLRGIAAGLHATIDLPSTGPDEPDILRRARARGLALRGLGGHWHRPGPDHPQGIIVGFGAPAEGAYPAAVDTLVQVLRAAHEPGMVGRRD
jgi:GntR family transcriptional regulator/MocR family aminotransferase